jgi:hypothetical protein
LLISIPISLSIIKSGDSDLITLLENSKKSLNFNLFLKNDVFEIPLIK